MNYSVLLISLLAISLSSCSTTKDIKVSTAPLSSTIQKQPAPRQVQLTDPKIFVINAKNIDKYLIDIQSGKLVIYGMTQKDFQKLMANQYELRRYIEQQKAIIVFYESQLTK